VELVNPFELNLPSREQRQQILTRVGSVLAEARALVQRLDERDDVFVSRKQVHFDDAVRRFQPKQVSFSFDSNWLSH